MEEKCNGYGHITHFKIVNAIEWPKAGRQLRGWYALHKSTRPQLAGCMYPCRLRYHIIGTHSLVRLLLREVGLCYIIYYFYFLFFIRHRRKFDTTAFAIEPAEPLRSHPTGIHPFRYVSLRSEAATSSILSSHWPRSLEAASSAL